MTLRDRIRVVEMEYRGTFGIKFKAKVEGIHPSVLLVSSGEDTHVAWLRVGLWLPKPRWFLNIRTYSNGGIKGGQHDLGAPVDTDPSDGARVRALADALLIEAGCLLVELEEAQSDSHT